MNNFDERLVAKIAFSIQPLTQNVRKILLRLAYYHGTCDEADEGFYIGLYRVLTELGAKDEDIDKCIEEMRKFGMGEP